MRERLRQLTIAFRKEGEPLLLGFHGGLLALLALTDVAVLTPMVPWGPALLSLPIALLTLSGFVGIPLWFAHRWRGTLTSPAVWLYRERFQHLWMQLLGVLLILSGIKSGTGPDLLVVLVGLCLLGAAAFGGVRYALGQLPVGAQRPARRVPPVVLVSSPPPEPLPPEEDGTSSLPPEAPH